MKQFHELFLNCLAPHPLLDRANMRDIECDFSHAIPLEDLKYYRHENGF